MLTPRLHFWCRGRAWPLACHGFAIRVLVGLTLAALFGPDRVHAAEHATRVLVEVSESAGEQVDVQLVRRLIRLELADVAVPPPHQSPDVHRAPPVYVRIVTDDGVLTVELWDHGLLEGNRRVSPQGGPKLTARSVALVTLELAKRLAERRRFEARAAALREERARRRSLERRGYPLFARVVPGASVEAATIAIDRAWLVGPGLDAELRLDNGAQLRFFGRGFTGSVEQHSLQWLELGLAPGYSLRLSSASTLTFDWFASAASLSVAGADRVDTSTSSSTWSARSGLGVRLAHRLLSGIEGHGGFQLGSTLRKVPVQRGEDTVQVGGVWLGVQLGATLDP